jgi:prephenate dehydratase
VARRVFPQGKAVAYPNFEAAYTAVENGACDCLVLPIENSFAGQVGDNIDLIFEGTLYITAIYELPIQHYLLGVKGAGAEEIRTVISHEQALEQCGTYIEEHGLECEAYRNTAMAAKAVAARQNKTLGAIASKETAELYGLDILAEKINDSNLNTTRFAVLSRKKNDKQRIQGHFVMMFTVSHQAGALARAIAVIGKYGFNMEAIKSRTLKGKLWQYYFYTEIEGNPYGKSGAGMVEDLKQYCDQVRIIGTYDAHVVI